MLFLTSRLHIGVCVCVWGGSVNLQRQPDNFASLQIFCGSILGLISSLLIYVYGTQILVPVHGGCDYFAAAGIIAWYISHDGESATACVN